MQNIHAVLKQYWGYDVFRPLQEDIIRSVLDGNDTLALLPTGGGKSLCFQVPAMAMDGICVVVSPLIALMKDQVHNLNKRDIAAVALFTGMTKREIDIALDNCVYGKIKFLYVSPERLLTEIFRERFKKMKVNLIAIDEAHCISQWGYDFRPPYLQIAELRPFFPDIPIIALTASATKKVCDDIQLRLAFKKNNLFRASFARPNIGFIVRETDNKEDKLLDILNTVKGSGVVYVRNRKKTQDTAAFLLRHKVNAGFYHAGLENDIRNNKQESWINGKTRIIVCTNAFGMGIDKPDVRCVVHLDIPESLEAYYQEAGRAGRDGHKSYAGLLYDEHDFLQLQENFEKQFPPIEFIRKVYHHLGNYCQIAIGAGVGQSFDFDLIVFCKQYQLKPVETRNALKILEQHGYIYVSEAFNKLSTVNIPIDRETLYAFQIANKQYEPVIKLILRTSPGVFDETVSIHESDLAYHLSAQVHQVKEILEFLHKQGIIVYSPLKTKPQVDFVQERINAEHLLFDFKMMEHLKTSAELRLKAITGYVKNKSECRVKNLLRYFDEDTQNCNSCDICVERNKLELSEKEFTLVFDWLKKQLLSQPMMPEALLKLKLPVRKEKVVETLTFLTDNKQIIHTAENILLWKE
ncbi:MAG TPA: ATP-dependent DNA helicase RecQ [Chitinophagales bacterium]|nr:ATP-dependent DNA helicase RecQ [Chitinophagales bacterium]HRG28032.1 ATP-dependent DNA helicase RecQ [Chitinophagales bacterium]HRG86297.1 ATP-dependent DNA helicase RecQ [Chitinophagales bacterium]